MAEFGNKVYIKRTLEKLRNLNKNEYITERDYREIDGMIALSVFSRPASDSSFVSSFEEETQFPYALIMKYKRTFSGHQDVIEFPEPSGTGFIIMNEAKVPRFTTRLDDGLMLLLDADWTISNTGLAKCERENLKFREKLRTPALSVCGIGLQLHLSRASGS
jgi:hypothetical protein